VTKAEGETETLMTVDDRYHELGERTKSCLDSPEFSSLHHLIREVENALEGLLGSRRATVIEKTRKILIAAVNSRIDRQLSGNPTSVRQYRPRRRNLDWRNK
jgi:hypothetical protein